jgi:hypothetical protein
MTPGRLVTVRRYLYREAALDDQQLLVAAGIDPHLKWSSRSEGGGMQLMVAKEHAERALEILSSSPQLVPAPDAEQVPACPACHSRDPDPRPAYALLIMGGGAAASAAAVVAGRTELATGIGLATAIASAAAYARVPRWKCRKCGRLYGAAADG